SDRLLVPPVEPLTVASSSSWPVLVARDLSASLFDLGGACPAQIGRRGSVSRGLLCGFGDGAVGVVVGEAMRPKEDGDRAVGIFVNADDGPDEVRPQTARRQLQAEPTPFHRVVVADAALFLD